MAEFAEFRLDGYVWVKVSGDPVTGGLLDGRIELEECDPCDGLPSLLETAVVPG